MIIVFASIAIVCVGSVIIGVKLEHPEANFSFPMPVVVLAVLVCSIALTFIATTDAVLRRMYSEFLRTEKLRENAAVDESGRTQITSMGE